MKLCKDCHWMRPDSYDNGPAWARCTHVASKITLASPVDGSERQHFLTCEIMRMAASRCGPDALLFEAKGEGP